MDNNTQEGQPNLLVVIPCSILSFIFLLMILYFTFLTFNLNKKGTSSITESKPTSQFKSLFKSKASASKPTALTQKPTQKPTTNKNNISRLLNNTSNRNK
tara:strand:+ start:779 stop:1078 length:300 start_codon:yes stop_codon:yes gene_type:complete